jgi:hypothetical protein
MFAGPGAGKSTTAAGVFSLLKQEGISCEYVHEWVKWPVWENRKAIFDDQLYIFAKQHHMLYTLKGQVDVAICDSPLLFSNIYGKLYTGSGMAKNPSFFSLVEECFCDFDNVNYVIERTKAYNPKGRIQTEPEAQTLDTVIETYLKENNHAYEKVIGDRMAIRGITNKVLELL